MASIQSLGVGSGLLTSQLVEDIIAAEREATDLRLGAKQVEFEGKISAFGSIKSTLDILNSSVAELSTTSNLLSKVASSSNEAIASATATSQAAAGVHSVEVLALARAHTLVTKSFTTATDIVGEGTLDFKFGTTTFSGGSYDSFTENTETLSGSITIDSSNNTLEGIRDAINDAGLGVTANIVNDGSGFLLSLTSDKTGEEFSMEITVTETSPAGLSALAFNAAASTPGTNFTQTVVAEDAMVTIDGITVTRDTNSVSEVIKGLTFELGALNVGTAITISVVQDTAGLDAKMQAFVDAFNSVKTLTDQLTAFDQDKKTGSFLTGDAVIRTINTQLRRFLGATIGGLGSSAITSLVDLGITSDQNNSFLLKFDSAVFSSALKSNPDDVVALLANRGTASNSNVSFENFLASTQAGTYDVNISQLATQGFIHGATTAGLSGLITIDDTNDAVTLTVDGVSSGTINIAQGSYTDGDALAQELQNRINADSALLAANRSVTVNYNSTDGRLEITSQTYGSGSKIDITGLDTNSTTTFGLAVVTGDATKGLNVEGTINGVTASGAGQFLAVPIGAQTATSGYYQGATPSGFPSTIDATNNTFVLSVDGNSSGTITLTESVYATGTDLAQEIEDQINGDPNFSALNVSVSVSYDGVNDRFTVTSSSTGSQSKVTFTSVNAATTTVLGFSLGAGVNGKPPTTASDDAGGIQIKVTGTTVGDLGSVTLVRGAMNQLETYLDSVLKFGGSIDTKIDSFDELLEDLNEESVRFNERMDNLEDRLRFRFAAADALISQLNNTASFLDLQLKNLPSFNRNKN